MAGAGIVFHVEFGINETTLTQVMEQQIWKEAERIIIDNSQTSFLDEGCYQRIPLFITLSGLSEGYLTTYMPRNLFIARLLVQHGANVNYRIPETCFGSEYMNPGHSALELVINFYNQITAPSGNRWDPKTEPVIGMHGEMIMLYDELLNQLCDLVFIMLGHGGNPNIQDEKRMTILHRVLVHSGDIRLLQILCENGADLNARDADGNVPLSALCEGNDDIVHRICPKLNMEFFNYMLSFKAIELDSQNRYGCTALFHCMAQGQFTAALHLLQKGCDATLRGKIFKATNARPVSPLLAALSSPELHDIDVEEMTLQATPVRTHHLAHIVDTSYFTKNQILSELETNILVQTVKPSETAISGNDMNRSCMHVASLGTSLIHLMFGGATTSLRQLCVRKIFQNCFFRDQGTALLKSPWLLNAPIFAIESADDDMLAKLVSILNLPKDVLICFHVELFRQKLCSQLQSSGLVHHNNAAYGFVASGSDTESLSDENDSDLEYW